MYDVLKETLTERTTLSEQKRLQQLLSADNLGDQKPIQLPCKMQQLHVLGEKAGAMYLLRLRQLFVQDLGNVRMILVATAKEIEYITNLAEMADSVKEVILPFIATVAVPQASKFGVVEAKVASLKRSFSALKSTGWHRSNSKSRSKRRTRLQSCYSSQSGACWCHRHFSDSAQKCTPPCTK